MKKIIIIGGGPIGCYTASLLAKNKNNEVTVFEEHKEIGKPIHCTGIVTEEILKFLPKNSKTIINKIKKTRIYSEKGNCLELTFKKPDLILNRPEFDKYFHSQAKKARAKFFFEKRFLGFSKNHVIIADLKTGKKEKHKYNILIGADGPSSTVGKSAGIIKDRQYFIGVQAIIKRKNDNAVEFFPLKDGFGWAVPENSSTLRVGVAVKKEAKQYFEKILKKYPGKIIDRHGGLIPLFDSKEKRQKENIFLVGDAAGFVKATTGGGLVFGLESSIALSNAINHKKNYESQCRTIKRKLLFNLKMHKILHSFSEKDFDSLILKLNSPSSKKILENINRDNLMRLSSNLILKNPSIAIYAIKHIDAIF